MAPEERGPRELTQKDLRDLPFGDKSQEVLKEQARPGE